MSGFFLAVSSMSVARVFAENDLKKNMIILYGRT